MVLAFEFEFEDDVDGIGSDARTGIFGGVYICSESAATANGSSRSMSSVL